MKVPQCFRKLSIRRKLMLMLLVPCVVVLLLAGIVLVGFQMAAFRRNFERDLKTTAQIVADNASGAVDFKDEPAAVHILQSLWVKGHVRTAVLATPDGKQFAHYGDDRHDPELAGAAGIVRARFRGNLLLVSAPVKLEGKQIATLHVLSDYRSVYVPMVNLVLCLLLLVAAALVAVAVLLSSRLQRFLSEPILRLADTARRVANQADYSVRAQEEDGEEFGVLTRAFNQMLARIQAQDAALTASQRKTETLIHSIDGVVWERAPEAAHFTFVSRQSERIFGYAPAQWLANPRFWHEHLHPDDAAAAIETGRASAAACKPYSQEYRVRAADGGTVWVRESGTVMAENGKAVGVRGIFLDITRQKQAAEQLEDLNRRLMETSRQIGRAEVATGVLHNVGNVINSINISAQLITEHLRRSRHGTLSKVAALMHDHAHDLGAFMTSDPKGKLLPGFMAQLAEQTEKDHAALAREMDALTKNIDHVKGIVAIQQNYARTCGSTEDLNAADLVEDALRMTSDSLVRGGITIRKEFEPVPPVRVDKHKVLQILVNLFRNAKYAMEAAQRPDKMLTLGMTANGNARIKITVRDNGMGIPAENLARLFEHGFTTRKEGHGFGLHSGLLAAQDLGGALYAASDGPGQGALFTLELPIAARAPSAPAEGTGPAGPAQSV